LFVYDTAKQNGLYQGKIIELFPKHDYRIFRWRAAVACLCLNNRNGSMSGLPSVNRPTLKTWM